MIDINKLLFNHQLAKLQAQHVPSARGGPVQADLVRHHARRITAWRRADGLPEAGWPRDNAALRHA